MLETSWKYLAWVVHNREKCTKPFKRPRMLQGDKNWDAPATARALNDLEIKFSEKLVSRPSFWLLLIKLKILRLLRRFKIEKTRKGCGVLAPETLTKPRVIIEWLLVKPRSFSNFPVFLDLNGRYNLLYRYPVLSANIRFIRNKLRNNLL